MRDMTAASLFRETWPTHTAKQVARAASRSVSVAKSWVHARYTPGTDAFLAMLCESEELRAELIRRLEEYGDAERHRAVCRVVPSQGGDAARPACGPHPAAPGVSWDGVERRRAPGAPR